MGELGFYGCFIPEEVVGNGLGCLAHTLISTSDNFAIPSESLIGQEGDGFEIRVRYLNHTRFGCAAGAIGLAKAAARRR